MPPLKNDIIIEKQKELEEYNVLKRMKAQFREEKRLQKQKDKSSRKKNSFSIKGEDAVDNPVDGAIQTMQHDVGLGDIS